MVVLLPNKMNNRCLAAFYYNIFLRGNKVDLAHHEICYLTKIKDCNFLKTFLLTRMKVRNINYWLER